MPKNRNIIITDKDFSEIAAAITTRYIGDGVFIDPEKLVKDMKKKNPADRYKKFSELISKYPGAWEYVGFYKYDDRPEEEENQRFRQMANQILPIELRNSGDPAVIEQYIKDNPQLNVKGKAVLIQRLNTLDKVAENEKKVESRINGIDPFAKRPKLEIKNNGNRFVLKVDMPKYQTSGNGCWSCGGQMLLQGRGITNVTQEDIRAYRPNYSQNKLKGAKFQKSATIDRAFNSDSMQNVMDMGDSLLAFAPDTMLRTLDILRYTEAEGVLGHKFTPEEREAYKLNAINLVKKTIRKTITETQSPITMSDGGHYITIVGMDGDNIVYKNSSSDTFNKEEQMPLSSLVSRMLNSKYKMQFVWMDDIRLTENQKTFYNVPSGTLGLNPDDTLKMPPNVIQYDANSTRAEQEQNGFRMRLVAGKETSETERIGANLLVDGVVKIEQAYFPKTVNAARLKGMTKVRKKEEEKKLRDQSTELLGYDPITAAKPKKEVKHEESLRIGPSLETVDTKRKYADDDSFDRDPLRKTRLDDKNQRFYERALFDANEKKIQKGQQINERYMTVSNSIGKNNPFYVPDTDNQGKDYIWDREGAVTAFRLEMTFDAMIPILRLLGKDEKADEYAKRFNALRDKLYSAENAITPEEGEGLSGWNGKEVVLPNGQIKMTHYFKNPEDIYEATMLLESLKDSVSIQNDLKLKRPSDRNYSPSILSSTIQKIKIIGDYSHGNILKACGKTPHVYKSVKQAVTIPDLPFDQLNKTFGFMNNSALQYFTFNDTLFESLTNEYAEQDLSNNNAMLFQANDIYKVSESFKRTGKMVVSTYNNLVKSGATKGTPELEPYFGYLNGQSRALENGWSLSEKDILGFVTAVDAEIYACEKSGQQINAEMKSEFEHLFNNVRKLKVNQSKLLDKKQIAIALYSLATKYINEPGMQFVKNNKGLLDNVCSQFIDIRLYDFSAAKNVKFQKKNNKIEIKTDEIKVDEIKVDEIKTDEIKVDEIKTDENKPSEESIKNLDDAFNSLMMNEQDNTNDEEIDMNDEELLKEFEDSLKKLDDEFPNQNINTNSNTENENKANNNENKPKNEPEYYSILDPRSRKLDRDYKNLDPNKKYEGDLTSILEQPSKEEVPKADKQADNKNLPLYKKYADYDDVLHNSIVDDITKGLTFLSGSVQFGEGSDIFLLDDFQELTSYTGDTMVSTYGQPGASSYGMYIVPDPLNSMIQKVEDKAAFNRYKIKAQKLVNDIDETLDSREEMGMYGHDETAFLKSLSTSIIKRAIKGYGNRYIASKTPLGVGAEAATAVFRADLDNGFDKKIKKWRPLFPAYDLMTECENQLNTLTDYWESKNKGHMNEELEASYRNALYGQTLRMQELLNRVERTLEDPILRKEIVKDRLTSDANDPMHLHPASARGLRTINASLDAYKFGLENGWAIDDIGVLATFNLLRIKSICEVKYNTKAKTDDLSIRKEPKYIDDNHKAFLEEMDQFYNKLKKTKLQSADARKKILNQMDKMMKEMKDKGYITASEKNYFDFVYYNARKRDKLIEAGTEKAYETQNVKSNMSKDSELELCLNDFNTRRTDMYFSKESKEHKNLRQSAEKVHATRVLLYKEIPDMYVKLPHCVNYFNSLEEAIYNAKVYQKEKNEPGTTAGKDRLNGSVKMEKLFREERNQVLGFVRRTGLSANTDSIEEFRKSIAYDAYVGAYNKLLRLAEMPTAKNDREGFTDLAADMMLYKFATSKSEANIRAFNNMGINNLKNEIKKSSEFKALMKEYFNNKEMTPALVAQQLDGDGALQRMLHLSEKFKQSSVKQNERSKKIEKKMSNRVQPNI